MTTTNCFSLTTSAILIIVIYTNTLQANWHYDDYLNIVKNTNVHLEKMSWKGLSNAFYAAPQYGSKLARPVAYLSFALNYYFHGDDVFGYHLVNILIHFISTLFLFLVIKLLLCLPACRGRYDKNAEAIACLAVLFWASHPIQVTAVTYIVQRMASFAAMFYIIGVYLYVKARLSKNLKWRCLFFSLCAVCGIFAFGCKENAIIFPVAIIFLEIFLFRYDRSLLKLRYGIMIGAILGGLFLTSCYYLDWSNIHQNFEIRPFSMVQRLLTEPRGIFFYLSLLLYPTTSRLALIHDFPVSTTLFQPWTTLPAILFLILIICSTFFFRQKQPLIAFCIIFFFLNHIVEGSFLSLELIYEHRNYLPSMLLFLPLAMAINQLLDYFKSRSLIYGLIAFCTSFVLIAHGHTTYMYNQTFRDGLALWQDNVDKAPNLSITHNNFGQALRMKGLRSLAAKQFLTAFEVDRYQNKRQKGIVLYNLGLVSAYEENNYQKAFVQFTEALQFLPTHPDLMMNMALASLILKRTTYTERLLQDAIQLWPNHRGLNEACGISYLDKKQPREAFHLISSRLSGRMGNLTGLYILAKACHDLNADGLAINYWEKVMKIDPVNPLGTLWLGILNSQRGRPASQNHYLGLLIYLKRDKKWEEYWQVVFNQEINRFFMPDIQLLKEVLSKAGLEQDF